MQPPPVQCRTNDPVGLTAPGSGLCSGRSFNSRTAFTLCSQTSSSCGHALYISQGKMWRANLDRAGGADCGLSIPGVRWREMGLRVLSQVKLRTQSAAKATGSLYWRVPQIWVGYRKDVALESAAPISRSGSGFHGCVHLDTIFQSLSFQFLVYKDPVPTSQGCRQLGTAWHMHPAPPS